MILKNCVGREGLNFFFWIIENFPMIWKPKSTYTYLKKWFIIKRDYRHLCFYTIWTRETVKRNNLNNLSDKWLRKKVVTDNLLKTRYFCYRAGKGKQTIFYGRPECQRQNYIQPSSMILFCINGKIMVKNT